jgi:uncharacterized protein (TIGR00369 family)
MVDLSQLSEEMQAALAADQGILDTFGCAVVTLSEGVCELACRVPDNLINARGFAHGSIAFAIMDTACAYALRSSGGGGVTIHGDTHFVRGAGQGDELFARVEVVTRTRSIATLRGETFLVEDGERKLAAHGSFVFKLMH